MVAATATVLRDSEPRVTHGNLRNLAPQKLVTHSSSSTRASADTAADFEPDDSGVSSSPLQRRLIVAEDAEALRAALSTLSTEVAPLTVFLDSERAIELSSPIFIAQGADVRIVSSGSAPRASNRGRVALRARDTSLFHGEESLIFLV